MTEADFLQGYDPTPFDRPSVTVDLVLMTVVDGRPAALLQQRADHPFRQCWALPGGFVGMAEGLDHAARRVLADKAGMHQTGMDESGAWLEQLATFGDPARDPRMRIITVAYFALIPADRVAGAVAARTDLTLAPLHLAEDGALTALDNSGAPLPLAFDHAEILRHALVRLRGKLDWSPIACALLPPLFTLRDLQRVHEAIVGRPLNKPAFRRRMLDTGWIEGTGEKESGTSYRPAELYRVAAKGDAI